MVEDKGSDELDEYVLPREVQIKERRSMRRLCDTGMYRAFKVTRKGRKRRLSHLPFRDAMEEPEEMVMRRGNDGKNRMKRNSKHAK